MLFIFFVVLTPLLSIVPILVPFFVVARCSYSRSPTVSLPPYTYSSILTQPSLGLVKHTEEKREGGT